MEWDFYGGFKGKIFPSYVSDFTYDVGVIYYFYPGGRAYVHKYVPYNTFEYYVSVGYKWFNVKFSQALTDYFGVNGHNPPYNWNRDRSNHPNGSSRYSTYIEASANYDLVDKWSYRCFNAGKLNALVHVGHVTVRHYEHLSYTDWRVTLTQEFDWFNVFLTYIGTDAKGAYYDVPNNAYHERKRSLGVQGIVGGVTRSF